MVNILDFNPEKLSIEKVFAINDKLEHIYYVKYDKDPFYLIIDDLKGYFKYSKEKYMKKLKFIIEDQKQAKIYNQIWNKIKELINNVDEPLDLVIILEIMLLLDLILMILYH